MSLAKDMTQLREELNNSREKRKAFISELSSEVSQFLKNSRDENAQKAKKTKEELATFRSNLTSEVSEFLKNSHEVNQDTALKTKDELSSFAGNLRQTVDDLMKKHANNLADARSALNGVQPPEAAHPQPIQRDKISILNDLRAIAGIGGGIQARLNKLGIHTYEQLAKQSPDELRKSLGKESIVKFADIGSWVREAKKLM